MGRGLPSRSVATLSPSTSRVVAWPTPSDNPDHGLPRCVLVVSCIVSVRCRHQVGDLGHSGQRAALLVAEEYSGDGERAHSRQSGAKATLISKEYATSFDAEVFIPQRHEYSSSSRCINYAKIFMSCTTPSLVIIISVRYSGTKEKLDLRTMSLF